MKAQAWVVFNEERLVVGVFTTMEAAKAYAEQQKFDCHVEGYGLRKAGYELAEEE